MEQHRMIATRHRNLPRLHAEPHEAQIVSALVPIKPRPGGHVRGLPLTRLSDPNPMPIHYALTIIDSHGRCADRSPLRSLQWPPGHHLAFTVREGAVHVVADPAGPYVTTRQGHLRFPAAVRHRCGMEVGERILLAALPTARVLIAYTAAALDTMTGSRWPLVEDER
jgi:hypothetical protein